jgi:hypothetical protein
VLASVYPPDRAGVRVVGCDIVERHLALAREGTFSRWSMRQGLAGFDRSFRVRGGRCEVAPRLRPLVRFEPWNLTALPPAWSQGEPFDAIFFRNVSIYWAPATTRRAVRVLTGLLADDGLLFVGACDPVAPPDASWEHVVVEGARVLRRRATAEPPTACPRSPSATPPEHAAAGSGSLRPRLGVPSAPPSPAVGLRALRDLRRPHPSPLTATPTTATSPVADASVPPPPPPADPVTVARSRADAGDVAGAIALLDAAREPGVDPDLHLWLGVLHLAAGAPREALRALRCSVFLEPNDPGRRRWLGAAYEAAGEAAAARRERRNAARLEVSVA